MRLPIEYKVAALRDVSQKKEYLETVLKNRQAARKPASTIPQAVSLLNSNPYMGAELRNKYDVDTDLRFLFRGLYSGRLFPNIIAAGGSLPAHVFRIHRHNSLTIVCRFMYNVIRGDDMNFYTVRELGTTPKELWDKLSADGEVVITSNGKPTALMFDISDNSFEETLQAVRQAKAMIAFNRMREKAAAGGFLSDEEIEAEISASRRGE